MLDIIIDNEKLGVVNISSSSRCIGVIGKNGRGKTTLLRCILNLDKYKGSIICDGKKITNANFLFSGDKLGFEELTILENIKYFLNINKSFDKNLVENMMNEFKIYKYKDILVRNVSEGTKQKMRLIICLLKKSNLIILDEPTNFLDDDSISVLVNHIKKSISKKYITASNDLNFINKISDEIVDLGEVNNAIIFKNRNK